MPKRVECVLPDIIEPEQSAFVKDTYIGNAVGTLADIIYFTKYNNIPGIVFK